MHHNFATVSYRVTQCAKIPPEDCPPPETTYPEIFTKIFRNKINWQQKKNIAI